jgi:GNAT superfamily N-acetyltransferase
MANLTHIYRAAKKLVRLLPAWLLRFRPFGVYRIPLPKSGDTPAPAPFSPRSTRSPLVCQVNWVTSPEAAALLRHLAMQECLDALNTTTRRVAAGWLNGEAIACAWIATESFDECELGLRFELTSTEVWLFAAVVDPRYRDQGVYRQLLEFLIDELGRGGVQRILFGVTLGNEPSRRAHARQGAKQIGSITAIRSLGLTVCRVVGGVRLLSPRAISLRRPIRLGVEVGMGGR